MPTLELEWGKIAKTGGYNSSSLKSIELQPGTSDGPCVGIIAGDTVIEVHAEDALRLAASLIDMTGWSKKKFGEHEWRWPDQGLRDV